MREKSTVRSQIIQNGFLSLARSGSKNTLLCLGRSIDVCSVGSDGSCFMAMWARRMSVSYLIRVFENEEIRLDVRKFSAHTLIYNIAKSSFHVKLTYIQRESIIELANNHGQT